MKFRKNRKYFILLLLIFLSVGSFQNCGPKQFHSYNQSSKTTIPIAARSNITPSSDPSLARVQPPVVSPVVAAVVAPVIAPVISPITQPVVVAPIIAQIIAPVVNTTYNPPAGIKYFGFFADGMEHDGTGNYLSETSKVANIHFISADTVEGLAPKLKIAIANNSKVIILVQYWVFEWQSIRLQANYKTNLSNLKNYLTSNGYLDAVVGFYLIDEPYFANSVATVKASEQDVYNNLKTAATEIHNNFGAVAVTTSEAFPTMDQYIKTGQWLGFPQEINWVAFNCYLTYGAICDTQLKYTTYIQAMKRSLVGNQRLFFTLDNYTNPGLAVTMQSQLIERSKFEYQLAKEMDAVAIVSFIYQSSSDRVGLADMPDLKNYIYGLGSGITGKGVGLSNTSGPSPSPATCTALPAKCEAADWVQRDSCGAVIGAWRPSPDCSTVKCEGADSVRRDSNGKWMETWTNGCK